MNLKSLCIVREQCIGYADRVKLITLCDTTCNMIDTDIEDIIFDGDERIEIACSYPDMKTAIKALDEEFGE